MNNEIHWFCIEGSVYRRIFKCLTVYESWIGVTCTFHSTAYGSIVQITRWPQHFWTSLCLPRFPELKLAALEFPGFTSKNNTPSLGGFNSYEIMNS